MARANEMTPAQWEAIRDRVADAVSRALNLEEDPVIDEVRTSETREEALGRMASIRDDATAAIEVILSFKLGPKDWIPGKRR